MASATFRDCIPLVEKRRGKYRRERSRDAKQLLSEEMTSELRSPSRARRTTKVSITSLPRSKSI